MPPPDPGSGFVCLEADLEGVPAPQRETADVKVVEIDMLDPGQVALYLTVHNDTFAEPWTVEDYEARILRHPTKLITTTFLLLSEGEPIGAASIGAYRENPAVGVGHYLGVRKRWQGQGFGRQLVLHRFHRLRQQGFARVEMETRLRHRESILLHFSCGFRPKTAAAWNTPQPDEPPELTEATRRSLQTLYVDSRARGETR